MPEKIVNRIDLSGIAGGAVGEKFNSELDKVLANIADPNTDPKATRTLTVKLTFKADEDRDVASVAIEAKSTLAPHKSVLTKFLLDRDRTGAVVGAELRSRQDGQVHLMDAQPSEQESGNSRVVGFNKIQGGSK